MAASVLLILCVTMTIVVGNVPADGTDPLRQPSQCNYVYETVEGEPYAVDVCRTIVTNGTAEYRKYICDGDTIKDEVYDEQDCGGNLVNTLTPTVAKSTCNYMGSCQYVMVKTPCNVSDTYKIQPVITDVCIDDFDRRNYIYHCLEDDSTPVRYQWTRVDNRIECFLRQLSFLYNETALYECEIDELIDVPYAFESECSYVYFGPTTDPTMDPTYDPTLEPTYMPSGNPTVNPTTAEPTTASPTAPTQSPTTASPTEAEGDGISRVAMVVNIIVVTFIFVLT